jgi:hypothetical protein
LCLCVQIHIFLEITVMRKLLLLLTVAICSTLQAQKTFIYCGQMIDVKNLQVLKEMTITIEGNKITDVQKGYTNANESE